MLRINQLALPLLLAVACGGPVGIIPGGLLSGEEASASSWSDVISESGILALETRPEDPYSVHVGYVYRDGKIYIDPAEDRGWYQNLKANPSVRVRFDDRVYRARAALVTDAAEREGFEPDRHVYRLELVE